MDDLVKRRSEGGSNGNIAWNNLVTYLTEMVRPHMSGTVPQLGLMGRGTPSSSIICLKSLEWASRDQLLQPSVAPTHIVYVSKDTQG